eukprot:Gb_04447 [translate_table: standard]
MKVSVVSRSGREIVKGGIELSDTAILFPSGVTVVASSNPPKSSGSVSAFQKREWTNSGNPAVWHATVDDLKASIHHRTKKYYSARQRLTLPVQPGQGRPIVLESGKKLKDYFEKNDGNQVVVFKDLGPQVSYRILFFWEYVGPLFIYPAFYYFPVYKYFGYPAERVVHPVQTYAMYYWCFHYFKRILETFFVHRFSHATSPLSNVFRNCLYYWSFGAFIAYFVNHPLYTPVSEKQMQIGFALGIVCQLANFYCHILLSSLRSPNGKRGYQIPSGFLFNIVTCANYTTEIYQWLGFNIATQTIAGYSFLIVATFIMTNWALAKHCRLKKASLSYFQLLCGHPFSILFDGKDGRPKYPRRWVILPPFL